MKFTLGILISLALMGSVACQSMTGKTAGRTLSDASITAAVQTKLTSDKASNFSRVDVDTERGMVNLSGVVQSVEERDRIARLAREVDGVRGVNNNLQIQSNPQ